MVKPDKRHWEFHQPFTATVPRDPVREWSPHDGLAQEARRVKSPELRRGQATDGGDQIQ